jgi:molecular chaperone Hsp33
MHRTTDSYLVGIWEEFNFRFLLTDITQTVQEVIHRHHLTHQSADLVAKVMLGSFFLAGMVKEDITVNIQLEGEGPIERVMGYSDRIGRMRGMAKHPHVQAKDDPTLGMGKGFFKVTRWGGVRKLHQSVTKMDKVNFESNLLQHIYESDQLTSFLSIFTKQDPPPNQVRGLILQALPGTPEDKLFELKERISNIEYDTPDLFSGRLEDILSKMETTLQSKATILDTGVPEFYCGCTLDKIKQVVVSIGKEEALSIIEERGRIQLTCEFCKEEYNLDPEDVNLLFLEKDEA